MKHTQEHIHSVIDNKHLVASEKEGFANTMVPRHLTFADNDLTERIRNMSVLETIN